MTNEDIVSLIKQNIDVKNNMELLYSQNKNFIFSIVKRYSSIIEMDDLMQEAYFGIYEAVEHYLEEKEVKFLTYAEWWIKQAMTRYIENNRHTIRIPSHTQALITKYKRYTNDTLTEQGREPTQDEYMGYMGMSVKDLNRIKKALYNTTVKSLDAAVPGAEEVLFSETIADDKDFEEDVINTVTGEELKEELWHVINSTLNGCLNASNVLTYRYVKKLTSKDAGQEIGLTGDMARTIEAKALQKLRRNKNIKAIGREYGIYFDRQLCDYKKLYTNDI